MPRNVELTLIQIFKFLFDLTSKSISSSSIYLWPGLHWLGCIGFLTGLIGLVPIRLEILKLNKRFRLSIFRIRLTVILQLSILFFVWLILQSVQFEFEALFLFSKHIKIQVQPIILFDWCWVRIQYCRDVFLKTFWYSIIKPNKPE